jgi:hypothetical protein
MTEPQEVELWPCGLSRQVLSAGMSSTRHRSGAISTSGAIRASGRCLRHLR